MTPSEQKKKRKESREKGNREGWVTLTALEICMVAIQLVLCMQLGNLCIQLNHLYSALKLLKKASFKLEPQYERSVLTRIFLRSGGEWGRC